MWSPSSLLRRPTSAAASAGFVSASKTWATSRVTPRFFAPASAIARSVAWTFGRMKTERGSFGLYSIETGKDGSCSATARIPSTSQSQSCA